MRHNISTSIQLALVIAITSALTSCEDFLTTIPKDALSPETAWQTEEDVKKFVTGCYDGWMNRSSLFYWDCCTDFGFANFPWEGYTAIGNGSISESNTGQSFYDFSTINRCNTVFENAGKVTFKDEAVKKDLLAQVRAIRAFNYFVMCSLYGGVPIVHNYTSAKEAQVPKESEDSVKNYIFSQLDSALLDINAAPAQRGRIARGAVLAMKMRAHLFWGDYANAKSDAQQIIGLNQYELDDNYVNVFTIAGQNSKEIILAYQSLKNVYSCGEIGQFFPNTDGGWSSGVPSQHLIDNYEMASGLTKDEAGSGYDPVHPFKGRDPRMALTVLYPGCDWQGKVFNTLDKKIWDETKKDSVSNMNYPTSTDNASKTSLSWRKYIDPKYDDIWDTDCCPVVFRYAEVLMCWAEAENELNGPSAAVYDKIDKIRQRAGMPEVDRVKYSTKEALRELIFRERGSEFAGEGLRRGDILRRKMSDGKLWAVSLMNEKLKRIVGTVDYSQTDPTLRAVIDTSMREEIEEARLIEERSFKEYNRYLPFPLKDVTNNPNLKQNDGY